MRVVWLGIQMFVAKDDFIDPFLVRFVFVRICALEPHVCSSD